MKIVISEKSPAPAILTVTENGVRITRHEAWARLRERRRLVHPSNLPLHLQHTMTP
jgi:hypothetical protein